MNQTGVNVQEPALPDQNQQQPQMSAKAGDNFRKLEQLREQEREARIRAEMQMEMMRKEVESIKQMMAPREKEPELSDDDYSDPAKLRAKLEYQSRQLERKAEEIAEGKYEEKRAEEHSRNYLQRLKSEFADYDQVMHEDNVIALQESNPTFMQEVLAIPDEYKRRKLAYSYMKGLPKKEAPPSVKEKVEENLRNPYHIPAGSGVPSAVEFDLKSKSAREAAYAKLKAAQRNPIGGQSRVT